MKNELNNIQVSNILKLIIGIIIIIICIFGICKIVKWDNEQELKYNIELIP